MSAHAAACKPQGTTAYVAAYQQFDSIIFQLHAPQAQRLTHSELEKSPIPPNLVVDSCPRMLRAAQPLISR